MSVTKVVEITYAIYQGLSKIQLCTVYVGRKVNNASKFKFCLNFPFACSPTLSPKIISWLDEPAVWSRDTGQRISCFESCQLIITSIFSNNDVPMVMVLLSYYLGLGVRTYGRTDGRTDWRADGQSRVNTNFPDQWVTKFSKVWDSPRKENINY